MHELEKNVVRKRVEQNKGKENIKCWTVALMDRNRLS